MRPLTMSLAWLICGTRLLARLSSISVVVQVTYLVSSERRAHDYNGSGGRDDFIRWKRDLAWWTHRSLNRNKEKKRGSSIATIRQQKPRTRVCTRASSTVSQKTVRPKQKTDNKAALVLRLGLPTTLIRHENKALRKRSSNRRDLKMPAFCFLANRKHFEKGAFRKRWRLDNYTISLTEFSSNKKFKMTGDWCVFKLLRRGVDLIWVKPPFLNSSSIGRDGTYDCQTTKRFWV